MAFDPSKYAYKPVPKATANNKRMYRYITGKVAIGVDPNYDGYDIYVRNPEYTGPNISVSEYFEKAYSGRKKMIRMMPCTTPTKYTDEPSITVYWKKSITWGDVADHFRWLAENKPSSEYADGVALVCVANAFGTVFGEIRKDGKLKAHYIVTENAVVAVNGKGMKEHSFEEECVQKGLVNLFGV